MRCDLCNAASENDASASSSFKLRSRVEWFLLSGSGSACPSICCSVALSRGDIWVPLRRRVFIYKVRPGRNRRNDLPPFGRCLLLPSGERFLLLDLWVKRVLSRAGCDNAPVPSGFFSRSRVYWPVRASPCRERSQRGITDRAQCHRVVVDSKTATLWTSFHRQPPATG